MLILWESSKCFDHRVIALASYGNWKLSRVKVLAKNKLMIIDHKVKRRHSKVFLDTRIEGKPGE